MYLTLHKAKHGRRKVFMSCHIFQHLMKYLPQNLQPDITILIRLHQLMVNGKYQVNSSCNINGKKTWIRLYKTDKLRLSYCSFFFSEILIFYLKCYLWKCKIWKKNKIEIVWPTSPQTYSLNLLFVGFKISHS